MTVMGTGLASGLNGCSSASRMTCVSGKGHAVPSRSGLFLPFRMSWPYLVLPHFPSQSLSGGVVIGVPVAWLK